ncbi:unnamed protein product [Owenia fusiformis]|uniref:Uncharacterized protein n=1 Tax=Owenia fusiformis TaxID=6347 RepID=A0A8J1UU41_OWEFU|nr:unnamed protein product [Owenia fusiformis]
MADVDVDGVIVLVVFYLIVLVTGIVAGRCFKAPGASETELSMVAGRKLGLGVGILTMSASFVGGGYLNGLAEGMALGGIAWTTPPLGIMFGLFLSAFVFGGPMRQRKYLTFFDPFQEKYGKEVTAFLFLAHLLGTNFYMAAILSALGSSLSVIIGLDRVVSIIISAVIAVFYTMVGMMVAVAYTDIIELILIVIGMGIAIPFAATNEHVHLSTAQEKWLGNIETVQIGKWIDFLVLSFLGSIPWQGQFQRFLSARSARDARIIGVVGGIVTFILAIAPLSIGAIGVSTDWMNTTYKKDPFQARETSLMLPLVMYHLTPRPVAIIALCGIAAAVMSSLDSSLLGSSALFCHNIYRGLIRKKASEREFMWAQRITIVVLGILASITAIYADTIYGLVLFGSEFGLVMVFPHLVCSMYIPVSNGYGALIGSSLSLILRIGGGDELMNLAPFIPYPPYDHKTQLFPVRILCVLVAIVTTVVISVVTRCLFQNGIISKQFDVLNQFPDKDNATDTNELESKKEMEIRGISAISDRDSYYYDNPIAISDDTK